MFTEAVIVAIITGITTILGSYFVNKKEATKDSNNRNERQVLIDKQLDLIQEKLDEHNHYASRFEEIEKAIIAIQKDIHYISKERS